MQRTRRGECRGDEEIHAGKKKGGNAGKRDMEKDGNRILFLKNVMRFFHIVIFKFYRKVGTYTERRGVNAQKSM